MKTIFLYVLLFMVYNRSCDAQATAAIHTLFHPVPRASLRDMQTDRPDVTESAITIDAGHFQLETDLAAFHRETNDHSQKSTWLLNNINVKAGLTTSTSLQLGFESYVREQTSDLQAGTRETQAGTGNLTLRIKQNITGNDQGNFALALLPYIKFPTATYPDVHHYQGGLIIPVQLKIANDWKLGGQLEVDRIDDQEGSGMHTELLQSLTLSHPLFKGMDGIAETYYTYDFKQHHVSNFINAAVQFEVFKDMKIDGGLNYGIQKDAEKRYFIGLSLRI